MSDPRPNNPMASILRFFTYEHLPAHLQAASEPFCRLAYDLAATYESDPELTVALRKLLEAKDAAMRVAVESRSRRNSAG